MKECATCGKQIGRGKGQSFFYMRFCGDSCKRKYLISLGSPFEKKEVIEEKQEGLE